MSYATDEDEKIRQRLAQSLKASMAGKGHPEMGDGFWDSLTNSPIFKGVLSAVKHIVPFIPGVGPIASTLINGAASALGGELKKRGRPSKAKTMKDIGEIVTAVLPVLAATEVKKKRGRPAKVAGGSAYSKYMSGSGLISVDGPQLGGNLKKERGKMVSEYIKSHPGCKLGEASKAVAAMMKNTI